MVTVFCQFAYSCKNVSRNLRSVEHVATFRLSLQEELQPSSVEMY
jgi:hypothetical protein